MQAAFDTEGDMAGLTTLSETRTASTPSALATESPANSTVAEPSQRNTALERDVLGGRDDIVGLVAHELRTPVAIIRAYAELLEAQLADQSEARATTEILHHILEQADLMADWVECMLDTQRLRLRKLPLKLDRVDSVQLAGFLRIGLQQNHFS